MVAGSLSHSDDSVFYSYGFYGIRLVGAGAKRTAVSFPMNYAIVYLMGPICNFLICCYEIARIAECIVIGPRDYSDKKGEEEQ